MTTFVLVPGAGGQAWYWHRVVPRLAFRGHDAVAVELPAGDEEAGFEDYVRTAVRAVPPGAARASGGAGLAVVGQSLGGLVAPVVAQQCSADLLVLVAPMIPRPGETGGEWWQVTDQAGPSGASRRTRDATRQRWMTTPCTSTTSRRARAEAMRRPVEQTDGPFRDPWPLDRWPDVPTRVVVGSGDRLFPPDFVAPLARQRAGVDPDLIDTGHLPALADPDALVDLLDRYAREVIGTP